MTSRRDNPWVTERTATAFETPWIRVDRNEVVHRVAGPSVYGTVHFKNRAIGVLPLADDGTTWLVGQHRYPLRRWSWEIPEGGGSLTGDALEDAKRELEEEAGLVASRWEKWFEMDLSNSVTDETATVFLARGLKEVPENRRRAHDATELLELRRLPLAEACRMARNGEIRDAISVAALFRAEASSLVGDPTRPLAQ